MKKIILILFITLNLAHAGAFDDRYPSARAAGMSNAVVAVANDVWAAYYNPAGLAGMQSYQTGFAYQKPFNYSFFTSVFGSVVIPISAEYGAVGVAFESFLRRVTLDAISKLLGAMRGPDTTRGHPVREFRLRA